MCSNRKDLIAHKQYLEELKAIILKEHRFAPTNNRLTDGADIYITNCEIQNLLMILVYYLRNKTLAASLIAPRKQTIKLIIMTMEEWENIFFLWTLF